MKYKKNYLERIEEEPRFYHMTPFSMLKRREPRELRTRITKCLIKPIKIDGLPDIKAKISHITH